MAVEQLKPFFFQDCLAGQVAPTDHEPNQFGQDDPNPEESGTWKRLEPFYQNELGAYLKKHHGLAYVNLYPYFLNAVEVKPPGIHFMSGKTVRTKVTRENHVVIARYGELLWDPHPSRAGLTEVIYWAFLIPYPEEWSKHSSLEYACHCPECGGLALKQSA